MNKNFYKTIFSKTRGEMVVVAENVSAEGQASNRINTDVGISTESTAEKSLGIKVLSFSIMLLTGVASIGVTTDLAQANVIADPNAAGNQRPTIINSANGTTQVNIQTPSQAGVSMNHYQQFDVNQNGVILNNSRQNAQTQLGGYIQGNPWLAGGEAKVIVNQVNSSNPSHLNGYIEVGGRKADVIIANTSGINVDGGGFINAGAVTLSTGNPLMNNGAVTGFQIRDGLINITGQGLDTSTADYTRLLSHAAQIDAGVWAKDLQIITGQNDIDAQSNIENVGTANSGTTNNTPKFAIDTGSLGGMYAGKISLISTDNGVGINNAGQVFASAGSIKISADGQLQNSGSVVAQHKENTQQATLDIQATELNNSGSISSLGKQSIQTTNLNNTGLITTSAELNIRNKESIQNQGELNAGRIDVETKELKNKTGKIVQTGLQDLSIDVKTLNNKNKGLIGYTEVDQDAGTDPSTGNGQTGGSGTENTEAPSTATGGGSTSSANTSITASFAQGKIKADSIENDAGKITANGGIDLTVTESLSNTATLNLKKFNISGEEFNNQKGELNAQSIQAQVNSLNNEEGIIRTNNEFDANVKQSLNNKKGQISSGKDIQIHDDNRNTLMVDNTDDGKIVAGENLSVQAKNLDNTATIVAGKDLNIALKDSFNVAADLNAGQNIDLSSTQNITNKNKITAGNELKIKAIDIDNQKTGEIQSNNELKVESTSLQNRGLINSNGLTHLDVSEQIENIGTGKVYGDHVAIETKNLINAEESIVNDADATQVETKAAVIAARERLDVGAKNILNKEEALISSGGDIAIGGTLDANKNANKDKAEVLINSSARIEAAGNGHIAVDDLQNLNNHFEVEEYLVNSNWYNQWAAPGSDKRWTQGVDATIVKEDKRLVILTYEGVYSQYDYGGTAGTSRWDFTQSEYDERIKSSKPAEIIIGGDLKIEGNQWLNDNSQILVGGTLFGNDTHLIENKETLANHRIEEHGRFIQYSYGKSGSFGSHKMRESINSPFSNIIKSTHHFEQPAMIFETQSAQANVTDQTEKTALQDVDATDDKIKTLTDFDTKLSNSSLFNTNPNNPEYLIETDPAFTNYKKWLGSDYMLQMFNTDPQNMHKRLGDGYYEQRLINSQIAQLTGFRRLEGYQSDEDQFKALMDSGVTFAQSMNLSLGISLSAEQIARLSSDIVWLVNETVTLADGSQQTVLVPKVYLKVRDGDLNHAGALISANVVDLKNAEEIVNQGAIAGRQVVDIAANNISNSGLIQSKAIQLDATDQIKFEGGTAKAQDYLGLNANRVELNSTTQTTGDTRNGNSTLDRIAGLYVTGEKDGILAVDAKQGIDAKGAVITNSSENGKTQLRATEGRVNLGTVDVARHESYGNATDKNHRISHQTAEVGTTINTAGDISILANDKVDIHQGTINSADGKVSIYGKQGVDITEGRATNELDQSVYSKSSGLLSSKKTLDQYQYKNDETVASVITGKEVAISSGSDLNIRGSQVVSQDLTQLSADQNINITAAENSHESRELHQVKKSGFTGSLSDGVASVGYGKSNTKQEDKSQSTSLTQSVVGSVNGNTNIIAGEDLTAKASIIESGKDINLIGKNVHLDAADIQQDTQSKYEHKSSGFSIGITYNGEAAAAASAKKSEENNDFSDSAVGKIMSSAETVRKATMAATTPVVFQAHNQKVTKTKDTASTQSVGTEVKAGGNLNILATEGDIRSQGAKISAEGDALLHAKNNIDLLATQNTESQTADSKRSGFSIDTRDHLAPLGVYNDKEKANGGLVQSVGTELSVGGKTTIQADEGNINIIGSKVVTTDDLNLNAGKDINIQSAQNSFNQSEDKKSKGWGSAQISDTERFDGYMASKNNTASDSVSQERSQVGSLEGNVNITAGNNYNQKVADVVAGKDLNITAKNIEIIDDHNTGSDSQSSKDLKIGVFSRITSPLLDLINAVDKAGKSKADDRTQALQGVAAAAQGYQTYSDIKGGALFKAESGIGFSTSKSNQDNSYSASQSNLLNAGGNINLTSTEGDIHLKNTQVNAKDKISLDSAKDILLESGQSKENADGKNSNAGASVGVGVSVGAQTGVYIYAEAGYGKGSNHVDATTHNNTTLNADQISIKSKGDTTLKGAQATANRIDADVGGNLNIISQQDTREQDTDQTGLGIRVQASLGTAWELSGGQGSGNINLTQADGSYKSVNQQSGLFAGDGGYHVKADHVDLQGGAIASTAIKENNDLTANSLSFSNIENSSSHEATTVALSGGTKFGKESGTDHTGTTYTNNNNWRNSTSFSPTLPQQDKGEDSSTTYATLSAGNINIGGKDTTVEELGIHSDITTANQKVDEIPDLQAILEKQKIIADATSTIVAAGRTYSQDQVKAATEKTTALAKEFYDQLSPEDQEKFKELKTTEKEAYLSKNISGYAEALANQKAVTAIWGIGGNGSRAVNAVTTALTAVLGGQTDLQAATNALAPYAAQIIGQEFGHGEDKNTAAQMVAHALLGATLAYINGGDPTAGGSAAVASEAAAMYFTNQYKDKKEYQDENGEFQPNLLPEGVKAQIRDLTAGIGAVIGGAVGDSSYNAQLAGVIGQNAVENNYLTKKQVGELNAKLNAFNNGTKACRDNKTCVEEIDRERNKLIEEYRAISKQQDAELKNLCFSQPNSSTCSSGLKEALFYNGSINTPQMLITRNLMKDRNSSSKNTLNIIYNSPNAKSLLNERIETVTDRANFFGTNNYYFNANGVNTKWFSVAENTSRTLLGAEGYGMSVAFSILNNLAKLDIRDYVNMDHKTANEWKAEAGDSLMIGGFDNFKNLYNDNYSSVKQWDIKQLKEEQKLLQPIHEKYLKKLGLINGLSYLKMFGGSVLIYNDRVEYGCKEMGYSKTDGCSP